MVSSGLIRRVAIVRTDISEEISTFIIRVTIRWVNVTSTLILVTMMMEALRSSETSVLTRSTRRNIPEETFFMVTAVKTSNLT
jgi:hypothetical protein